jgi:hypothetical protein
MHPVKQIANSCFLACIESFLKDHSKPMTQAEIILILSKVGLCSDEGVVNRGTEAKACKAIGIRFSDIPFHYPIDKKYSDGSLLIGTTVPGNHCVRFFKQEEEAKIIIMDPATGDFRYWDKPDFENSRPLFHRIEISEEE